MACNLWSVLSPGDHHKILDFGHRNAEVSIFGDTITAARRPTIIQAFVSEEISDATVMLSERWDLTAVVGVFTVDELVIGGTSGATGFIQDAGTPAQIIMREGRWTPGETITGESSGATAVLNVGTHGRAEQNDGTLIANTGTGATSELVASSHDLAPYVAGQEAYGMATICWPDGAGGAGSGVNLLLGLGHGEDSLMIGYQDGIWGLRYIRDGVVVGFFPQAALDDPLDGTGPSGITLNPTTFNVFWGRYGYLGAAGAEVYIMSPDMRWHLIQRLEYTNSFDVTIFRDPNITMRMEATKSASSATNYCIATGSWNAGSVGPPQKVGVFQTILRVLPALVAGVETPVFAVRVLRTHFGKKVHKPAKLRSLSVAVDGAKSVVLRLRKNSIITGGAWSDVDPYNSDLEANLTPTGFSAGKVAQAFSLDKNGAIDLTLDIANYEFHGGDVYVLTAESSNVSEVSASLRIVEPK